MNLSTLKGTEPVARARWSRGVYRAAMVSFALGGRTRVAIEGEQYLPREPAIFAVNHTHSYDFLPMRVALFGRGLNLVTWIKARAFGDPLSAAFFSKTGNIPLCSRGYVIAADFRDLIGRRPSEDEYRALRDFIDDSVALPDNALFAKLQGEPRDMLGIRFEPSTTGYRDAIRTLYFEMMQATLELARRCVEAGHHMQIYPQGSVSRRLSPGHVGIIHAAMALRLPIIASGQSGCREAFVGAGPLTRKGQIVLRLGEPAHIDYSAYPGDFRAFHPDDEDRHRARLEADTAGIMERVNALLDPAYQWAPDRQSDGKQGTARFF
ncbi:MAG: 1-acyl-sn-glycerol-3-phosphate acyltransferase [Bradymonadaceae bacterium]|nr:1-acyl-sn-glycerol-3-phosphate acyltransferase [Lujinxingiaceae bacterium]